MRNAVRSRPRTTAFPFHRPREEPSPDPYQGHRRGTVSIRLCHLRFNVLGRAARKPEELIDRGPESPGEPERYFGRRHRSPAFDRAVTLPADPCLFRKLLLRPSPSQSQIPQ
jgi:hypothetical protein